MGFALFFAIFLTVIFLMHYLVYYTVTRSYRLGPTGKRLVGYCMLAAGCGYVVGGFLYRATEVTLLYRLGNIWFGFLSIGFAVFTARAVVWIFLRRHGALLTTFSLAIALVMGVYSLWNGGQPPVVNHYDLKLKGMPESKAGFSILHMSDLHVTRFKGVDYFKRIVATANRLQPDLVAVTGDIIDDHFDTAGEQAEVLAGLDPRIAVYAVTGNHDHYSGLEAVNRFAQKTGWTFLHNKRSDIGGWLTIAGIDDKESPVFENYRTSIKEALGDRDRGKVTVLLSHRAEMFDEAAQAGVALTLAGHSHAGQIPPMDLLVRLVLQYPYGLYRNGDSVLYTTCGTSTWGPPMRFSSKNEMTLFRLYPATEKR